jgi:hypothetical protein
MALGNLSLDDSFRLQSRIMTEVYQQPKVQPSSFKVIMNLCPVLIGQFGGRFQFDDDFVETDEIGLINLSEGFAFVVQSKLFLCLEGNALCSKLDFKTFRIYALEKPAPFLVADFKACPHYPIALIFSNDRDHTVLSLSNPPFVLFVSFVVNASSRSGDAGFKVFDELAVVRGGRNSRIVFHWASPFSNASASFSGPISSSLYWLRIGTRRLLFIIWRMVAH